MRRSEAEAEFMSGFDAAAKQDADEFRRLDARIAELEAALRQIRADLDSSEDIPTTCALVANKIDDLLANRDD